MNHTHSLQMGKNRNCGQTPVESYELPHSLQGRGCRDWGQTPVGSVWSSLSMAHCCPWISLWRWYISLEFWETKSVLSTLYVMVRQIHQVGEDSQSTPQSSSLQLSNGNGHTYHIDLWQYDKCKPSHNQSKHVLRVAMCLVVSWGFCLIFVNPANNFQQ